jgi:hypothetical protein
MPTTPSTLTIAGVAVDRGLGRVVLHSLTFHCDSADELEFSQVAVGLGGASWHRGAPVQLQVPLDDGSGGSADFAGEIVSRSFAPGPQGYVIGYLARGLRHVIDRTVAVTNPGLPPGSFTFNLPSDDQDYVPAYSGLSVGQILKVVLDAHLAALAAAPVGVAGYTLADFGLSALAVVPPRPVTLAGPLMAAIGGLLEDWAGQICCVVRYEPGTSDWRIRFLDTAAFTPQTLTLGVDPVDLPAITEDSGTAASRTLARGYGDVRGVWLSTRDGTLLETYPAANGTPNPTGNPTVNAASEAAWKLTDFTNPGNAVDVGAVTSVTGNTATVSSDSGTRTWAVNFWNGIQAVLYLEDPTAATGGAGVDPFEQRIVTACTALTAGGTATITWDASQPVSSATITRYRLVGRAVGGLNECYRSFAPASALIANALVARAPYPVPAANATTAQLTNYPMGLIQIALAGIPQTPQVDPVNKRFLFPYPTVKFGNTDAALAAGGAAVTAPTDVQVFALYSAGALQVACPADTVGYGGAHTPNYDGDFYTEDGVARTEIIDLGDGWTYAGATAATQTLACVQHATTKNVVRSGNVTYRGKLAWALTLGNQLNLAANYGAAYTTGWEAAAMLVRSARLEWPQDGGSLFLTHLAANNQRRRATGLQEYESPAFALAAAMDRGESVFVGGMGQLSAPEYNRSQGVESPEAAARAAGLPTAEGVASAARGEFDGPDAGENPPREA